jgi:hypothetical protein
VTGDQFRELPLCWFCMLTETESTSKLCFLKYDVGKCVRICISSKAQICERRKDLLYRTSLNNINTVNIELGDVPFNVEPRHDIMPQQQRANYPELN